ncbi:hypothetical protein Q6A51_19000 [Pseudomonas sp. KFB-139]|uniref:Lipoprotein n=1 Tax=Pseudomonas serbiensis TaxID=3064350 RepID=A0ABT9CYE2_9PSED|nr:hypothetical protein [Pseudomonas sp. KFB-138]MDO7928880.1 hypothetical protein [Pseudomonas sp. KFB-138]
MLKLRQLLAVCFVGSLAGCASMPDEMKLDSKVYSAQNAGLVVGTFIQEGAFGTWLGFRDVNTGKNYGWGAKDYYSAWLPAGEYEVSRMGARRGVMGAYSKPLRFTVKQGEINYLGEMVYGCPSSSPTAALYGVMSCGFLALGECTVPYPTERICVVDRQEQATRILLKQNPEYSNLPVRGSVMSVR